MADVLYTSKSKKSVDSVLLAEIGIDDDNQLVEINPVGKISSSNLEETDYNVDQGNQMELVLDLPIEIWESLELRASKKEISCEQCLIEIVNEYIQKNSLEN